MLKEKRQRFGKTKNGGRFIIILGLLIALMTVLTACGSLKVTNEEFLETLGKGLTARWEAAEKIDRNSASSYLEEITDYDTYIQAEWDVIKKFQGKEFVDEEFGKLASDYLMFMKNAKDAYEYKENYVTYFAEMYKGLGGATDILSTFAEKYDLYEYIDRKYWSNLEHSTGVCKQIPADEITNTDWEGIYEVSFKFGGEFQLHVHDIDKEMKECSVDFRTEDDEITNCSAMILDNSRLYFELQGNGDSQPTKFTINMTEEGEKEQYSLKLINEEYESDDERIYDFVMDYNVADGDMTITRMSEKEWEQNKETEEDISVETEEYTSDLYNTFVGIEGTYICTSASEGDWTGRVEISEISGDSLKFSLGTLEGMPDLMTEYAQIVDSNTAQVTAYGVTLTFYWTDAENMSVSRSGEFTGGTDAGTLGEITDNQIYTRPLEFNQW